MCDFKHPRYQLAVQLLVWSVKFFESCAGENLGIN